MQTNKWGPPTWDLFHAVAHNYDPYTHEIEEYYNFYRSIGSVLPCKYCRDSYPKFFEELPIREFKGSQKDMARWAYLMHCKVNDKLRKQGFLKSPDPSFEEIYAKYDSWRAGCSSGAVGPAGMCGGSPSATATATGFKKPAFPGSTRCKAQTGGGKRCSRMGKDHQESLCNQHHRSISRTKPKIKISDDADYYFA